MDNAEGLKKMMPQQCDENRKDASRLVKRSGTAFIHSTNPRRSISIDMMNGHSLFFFAAVRFRTVSANVTAILPFILCLSSMEEAN